MMKKSCLWMPAAILACVLIGWVAKPRLLVGEMRLNGYRFRRKGMYFVMLNPFFHYSFICSYL